MDTIIILDGNTPIAAVKSQDIITNADTIETASATQPTWREFIAGRKDWQLTVNYLLLAQSALGVNGSGIEDILQVGNTFQFVFCDDEGSEAFSGKAILTQCKITDTIQTLAKGSFSFRGKGALEKGQ
jgi:predicted secreted protein